MSNWIFYQVLTNAQLSVWFDVRLFSDGSIEIFPWVENGWLLVSGDTDFSETCTVNINGVDVFSQVIDLCNHTRNPLVSGTATACSYWYPTNPKITPAHNTVYLMATKLVPNYPFGATSAAYIFTQSYTPGTLADVSAAMGNTGFGQFIGIIPGWSATYLAGGADPRAYNYVICNGLAAGSWSIHYRDYTTKEVPNYSNYPDASIEWTGTPSIPSSAGNVNRGGTWDNAHHPSLAFLPWLLTARWWFLDELLLWDFRNYLFMNYSARGGGGSGASAIWVQQSQDRSQAWSLRTMAQALCAVPASHPSYSSLENAWAANMSNYRSTYVDGTNTHYNGAACKNNLGCLGLYSSSGSSLYSNDPRSLGINNYWWGSPWMNSMRIMSIGYAWDLGLPETTTALADHQAVRDFGYTEIVGRAQAPSTGWDYRSFSVYTVPYHSPASGGPGTWFPNWGAAYSVYVAYANYVNGSGSPYNLNPIPAGTTMYYQNNPLQGGDGGDWATSSATAINFAALTYAASHGAPGAAQGWQLITSSSSFTNEAIAAWQDVPIWGIYPVNPPA